jgi:hypothetical protein
MYKMESTGKDEVEPDEFLDTPFLFMINWVICSCFGKGMVYPMVQTRYPGVELALRGAGLGLPCRSVPAAH